MQCAIFFSDTENKTSRISKWQEHRGFDNATAFDLNYIVIASSDQQKQ